MSDLLSVLKFFTPSNSSTNSSDSRRQVLTRLKFIGSISPHEKIDSKSLKVESTSFWTPLKRWLFTGDSRDTTLNFLSSTIDRSFEIVAATIHNKNVSEQIFAANILQDLMTSVRGLRSVQKTYADDKLIVCEIEVLVQNIQGKLFEIQRSHPQLFTIKDLCIMQLSGKEKSEEDPIPHDIKPPPKNLQTVEDEESD